jgi:predicted transcriptional regulator
MGPVNPSGLIKKEKIEDRKGRSNYNYKGKNTKGVQWR